MKQNKLILYATTRTNRMTEVIRIPNIENYTTEIINGELILTPKKQYMTENELNITSITHSSIEECLIKKGEVIISTNTKYSRIIKDILESIQSQQIWQNRNSYESLKVIFKLAKEHNLTIKLSIKLETGRIVHFKI